MIKVFQVSSDSNIGGAGKCILTFLEHYDRKLYDMSVVLPKGSLLKAEVLKRNVPVIEAEGIGEKSLGYEGIKNLIKIFREEKPDIVHTHASMSARIAARICGVSGIVYTRHSVFEPSPKISKGIGKKINGFINNFFTDKIIAVAEAAKQNLVDCGVSDKKISVVLNGIKPVAPMSDEEKAETREKYGISPNEKVISLMARIEDVKGHKYLIDAARSVLDRGFDIKVLIAGTGSLENELKAKVSEMGLSQRIIFTGFVEDVRGIINITDISANASFGTEATSIALLEGMCLGKPAVVSDFGGNPGVIKDGVNGFLFPSENAEAMADRLCGILSDEGLYKKLSRGAKETFEKKFTAEVYTENIENIYQMLLGGRKNG